VLDGYPTLALRLSDNSVSILLGKWASFHLFGDVGDGLKEEIMQKKSGLYIGTTGKTPIGKLWLAVSDLGLVAIECNLSQSEFETYLKKRFKRTVAHAPDRIRESAGQLIEYLFGRQQVFTFAIDWTVLRPFQQAVLQATYEIPYGETSTYKAIAERIGRPRAARAVGRAEATNPMPLVLPCHRVIGVDGKLHGYGLGEGVRTKEWLLKMEGAVLT
jgi:methylated-DNA-[protein]-cysteine S-methyltransferase